jgi:ferredoxin
MKGLRDKLMIMDEEPVMTKYKVVIDKNKCIGAGSCIDMAGLTFQMGEDKKAELIDQDGNSDEEKLMAAQVCPNMAITIINTETGETVWPK